MPQFRLPRAVIDEDIAAIVQSGIEVKLGESFDAQRLLQTVDRCDAVLLAVGANRPRMLRLEGLPEDAGIEGLRFMKRFKPKQI